MRKVKKGLLNKRLKVLLFLLFFVIGFVFVLNKQIKKQIVRYTVYPTLYSSKKINDTAVEANPKFKNLITFKDRSFLANVKNAFDKKEVEIKNPTDSKNIPKSISNEKERGSWLWTPTKYLTKSYVKEIIEGAINNDINVIYLSIDSYLDIYTMPNGQEKNQKLLEFDNNVLYLIDQANDKNIEVDLEAGWQNWSEEEHLYKPFAIADYVIDFNKKYKNKVRGIQYDIEPYLLEKYQENKKEVLKNYLQLAKELTYKLKDEDLKLTFVIPDFYDAETGETPIFYFENNRASAFKHLLTILDKKNDTSIILMSYRNFSIGEDSSVEISRKEIETANKHQTKIIIAQETGDFLPPYITFFNTRKQYFEKQTSNIIEEFKDQKSFGGLAIHYINTLLEMR